MLKFKKFFSTGEETRLDPDMNPVMYDCGPIWKDNEDIINSNEKKIPHENTEDKETMKILFIDDDPIARDMMKRFSDREENVDVTTAEDGSEGLKLAKEVIPDVIIVDLNMPVLDGFQVLHELKGASKQKKAPVIILTSDESKWCEETDSLG
jgi:CheY-like chemotaxis protein